MQYNSALPQSYFDYQNALTVIGTIYAGCFVMVSNHYILRAKVQHFFQTSSISSQALHQFLVDVLTNLSYLTFVISTLIFFGIDCSLSVMVYSDASWSGLLLALIALRGIKETAEQANWKLMFFKNIIFLIAVYAIIAGHYISNTYQITLGVFITVIYFINLALEAHEDRFAAIMTSLFKYKALTQPKEDYRQTSRMVTPGFLARRFPVNKQELNDKLKAYQPRLKAIKLNTKANITGKLLKIALAVHLSNKKFQERAKLDVAYYYGTCNGTLQSKSKKFMMDRATTNLQSQNDVLQAQSSHREVEQQSESSVLFYIFPVKLFESSQVLSILFSVTINLGFGFLMGLAVYMTQTIQYGEYFQLIYGWLLVPLLPVVGRREFFNSMVLSALWKYCFYGIVLCIDNFTSGMFPFFSFPANSLLSFAPIIQGIAIVLLVSSLFWAEGSAYNIVFIWFGVMLCNTVMIYKSC